MYITQGQHFKDKKSAKPRDKNITDISRVYSNITEKRFDKAIFTIN